MAFFLKCIINLRFPYRQGSYGLRKVMEIANAVFQALESFGKRGHFKMAMEKFWIFVGGKF